MKSKERTERTFKYFSKNTLRFSTDSLSTFDLNEGRDVQRLGCRISENKIDNE